MSKLDEKKKNLETELSSKAQQFQDLDNLRNNLANEILRLRGKIDMLEELLKEEKKDAERPDLSK